MLLETIYVGRESAKGVLYKDIVGQRADPDLTSTWPTLARPHGSEEVRV